MIKQRILLTEIPEDKYIRYTRSHNLGNIRGENLHIWAVERKKIISRKVNIFPPKTTPQILSDLLLFVWCMLTLVLKLLQR